MKVQNINKYDVNFQGLRKHTCRHGNYFEKSMDNFTDDYFIRRPETDINWEQSESSPKYIIEGAEDFSDDSDCDMQDDSVFVVQDKTVNQDTKRLVNKRLSKYGDKKNGMVYFDDKVLYAVYKLKPETIANIGSNRLLYTMCADGNELKLIMNKKILSTEDRILKLSKLEDTFTEKDLENITKSVYENSHQAIDFLKWLLVSADSEEDEQLVNMAKRPIRRAHNSHKESWFSKVFKH